MDLRPNYAHGLRKAKNYSVIRRLVRQAAEALQPDSMMKMSEKLEGPMVSAEATVALTGSGRDSRQARAEFLDRTSSKKGREVKEPGVLRLPPELFKLMKDTAEEYQRRAQEKVIEGRIVPALPPDYERDEIDASRLLPEKAG